MLPEPTLRRLPWYLAYIDILKNRNVEFVSSTNISKALSVDASQIAKDLSFLNLKGKTRIGYEVGALSSALEDFLGFSRRHKAYVIGAGSLGTALIQDSGLSNYGLEIVAGFDINPVRVGRNECGVPILHVDDIYARMESEPAEIRNSHRSRRLRPGIGRHSSRSGNTRHLEFHPYRVKVADGIVMANTSIYAHLALIFNRLNTL